MLSDEWFDDGESLTRAWRSHYPCASKGIDNVYPSSSNLTTADNQLFITFMVQIWNARSILNVFHQ